MTKREKKEMREATLANVRADLKSEQPNPQRSLHVVARSLRGLERVCKLYGRMKCGEVMMAWDYANDVALPEKELRADKERWKQSERTRWHQMAGSATDASDQIPPP